MAPEPVILAFAPNLFFAAPIRDTAHRLGYRVEFVRDEKGLAQRLQELQPKLLILDLAAQEDWPSLIRTAKAHQGGESISVLAFGNHQDLATREQALAAGADAVVSNARFAAELPQLLEKYSAKGRS